MFDEESGQVFREWTVPARPRLSDGGDWSRKQPFNLYEPRRQGCGPLSLVDMTIRIAAKNAGRLSKEHLEPLPKCLLSRLWRFLEARGICLQAWKSLSQVLLQHESDEGQTTLSLYRFRQHICRPEEDLKLYTQPLTSVSATFITHLVISGGCLFSSSELLALADMPNLGALELIKPGDDLHADSSSYPRVSDRLIRGWSEARDPFPLLRVLRISAGDQGYVTAASLRWAARFPSLGLYDIVGAREDWASAREEAAATGWQTSRSVKDTLSTLRYLMLLAPSNIEKPFNDMRRRSSDSSIDVDLASLCSDSRCAVTFVPRGDAPPLLDYVVDPAKASSSAPQPQLQHAWNPDAAQPEAKYCHGIAFEVWAFWLYTLIGQLSDDRDLASRGLGPGKRQAVAGPFALPSKPMASLFLGHSGRDGIASKPSYVSRGLFATTRHTFTRPVILHGAPPVGIDAIVKGVDKVPPPVKQPPSVKRAKKRRLQDVLNSFS